tara:strand:- start:2375 stop:3559 length:1185 start_codon:yes stop_codon:yes gene_type:complete
MLKIYKLINVTVNTLACELTRVAYWLTIFFVRKNIWIICETELQAQENGYELYQWIKINSNDVDAYYVLDKSSPAAYKFKSDENLLWLGSLKQIFYMFHAKRIISTHGLWLVPNEIGILKKITRKTLKAKRVMLNHGVGFLKNGKSFYQKEIFPLNDMIVSLSQKHKNIFLNEYGYESKDVVITGYPRFDKLIDRSDTSKWSNLILFIPTFRDGEQKLGPDFISTELYRRIKDFIKDPKMKLILDEMDAHIGIYLHQNIQDCSLYLEPLSSDRAHIIKQGECSVTELLQMGKLLITDYSSVFFDFVYMDKPFISYQFDVDEFLAARTNKPLIDIKNDLPGFVLSSHDELVDLVRDIASDGFNISDEHKYSASEYFEFQDTNNCRRVYEAIKDLG